MRKDVISPYLRADVRTWQRLATNAVGPVSAERYLIRAAELQQKACGGHVRVVRGKGQRRGRRRGHAAEMMGRAA